MLNYALGYSNETGKTVGPIYFYWLDYVFLLISNSNILSGMLLQDFLFLGSDLGPCAVPDVLGPIELSEARRAAGRGHAVATGARRHILRGLRAYDGFNEENTLE